MRKVLFILGALLFSTNCYCQKFNVGDTVYYNTNKIVEKCIVTKCYPEELCYDVIGIDSGRKGYFAENKLSKEASRVVSNQVENDNRVVDVNYGDNYSYSHSFSTTVVEKYVYCEIVGRANLFSGKVTISID